MILLYNAFLFLITFAGGSIPLWSRSWTSHRMQYLLAFSGSFLLGITFLHLLPETVMHNGNATGILLLAGFFGQQLVQKWTHGVEHGHAHIGEAHHHPVSVWPIFAGLAVHAFSEGLPLGISYTEPSVLPSLFLAIALHKLPEAMLITALFYHRHNNKSKSAFILALFALITPLSSLGAFFAGEYSATARMVIRWCIPLIAGAFIHIATTIFFESGTRAHEMRAGKWTAILLGIGSALLTLFGGHMH